MLLMSLSRSSSSTFLEIFGFFSALTFFSTLGSDSIFFGSGSGTAYSTSGSATASIGSGSATNFLGSGDFLGASFAFSTFFGASSTTLALTFLGALYNNGLQYSRSFNFNSYSLYSNSGNSSHFFSRYLLPLLSNLNKSKALNFCIFCHIL